MLGAVVRTGDEESHAHTNRQEDRMPSPKFNLLVRSLESLAVDKVSVANREKRLIATLSAALAKIGYHVVARRYGTLVATMRSPLCHAERRRKRMSAAARQAASRRMKAHWAKRRAQAAKSHSKQQRTKSARVSS
jgi:hypothetical protein